MQRWRSWTILCAACSLGEPHEHHDEGGGWTSDRRLGIAVRDERDLGKLRGLRDIQRLL